MRPLAIIDSDAQRCAELCAALKRWGFRAECFTTATAAIERLRTRSFALAIIGLDLGDADPYTVCREISAHLPIITLGTECAGDTCVRALESGADDCVVHATSARELVARIRSVLRRSDTPADHDLDALYVSLSEMRVRAGEVTHDLTRGETELLAVLLEHSPAPVPITRLIEFLDARRGTIESRIKSLRKKLGAERLVSRGGLGYQLVTD